MKDAKFKVSIEMQSFTGRYPTVPPEGGYGSIEFLCSGE